jgi:hypothetical protein
MKRTLSLVAVLLFTCSLAWAEEAAPQGDVAADSGGGCMAAGLAAGLQIAPTEVQVPPCPTTFLCSSLTNCGAGACSVTPIGQCCMPPTGPPAFCCINGIKKITCPCVCTGNPCLAVCGTSTEVRFHC